MPRIQNPGANPKSSHVIFSKIEIINHLAFAIFMFWDLMQSLMDTSSEHETDSY